MHELFNKYLRWSRSRAKVTAPAPAKYPGSGRLRLRNPASKELSRMAKDEKTEQNTVQCTSIVIKHAYKRMEHKHMKVFMLDTLLSINNQGWNWFQSINQSHNQPINDQSINLTKDR